MITLGIIGVVAALTIPSIITNYQKKETASRLKKAYSVTQQAIKLSEIDNNEVEFWDTTLTGHEFFYKYIKNYVKYTNELTTSELKKIAPRKDLNGNNYSGSTYAGNNSTHIFLADGTMITFNLDSDNYKGLWVGIDTNGQQKPKKIGKDTFLFFFSNEYGLQPLGGKGTISRWNYGEYDRDKIKGENSYACNKNKKGYWCAALIMNDGWEIAPDYPW